MLALGERLDLASAPRRGTRAAFLAARSADSRAGSFRRSPVILATDELLDLTDSGKVTQYNLSGPWLVRHAIWGAERLNHAR